MNIIRLGPIWTVSKICFSWMRCSCPLFVSCTTADLKLTASCAGKGFWNILLQLSAFLSAFCLLEHDNKIPASICSVIYCFC